MFFFSGRSSRPVVERQGYWSGGDADQNHHSRLQDQETRQHEGFQRGVSAQTATIVQLRVVPNLRDLRLHLVDVVRLGLYAANETWDMLVFLQETGETTRLVHLQRDAET